MTKFEDFAKHTVAMYQMFLAAQGAGSETEMPPLTDPLPVGEQKVLAAALALCLQSMEQPLLTIGGVGSVTDPMDILPREFSGQEEGNGGMDDLVVQLDIAADAHTPS